MQRYVMTPRTSQYSPEFRLILAILSSNRAVSKEEFNNVDWLEFFRLIQRHRVSGLVANLLLKAARNDGEKQRLPADIAAGLGELQRQSLAREMVTLVEARSILKLFDDNGLAPILLKGLTLSHDAFGQIGWRNNYDTDILLRPDDIIVADRLLRERNYRRFEPAETSSAHAWTAWRRQRKDAAYRHEKTDSIVELHWRLFDNSEILSGAINTRSVVLLGNLECRMLEPGLNFAYICCHGSQHAFSRLKWLADVYYLARKMPASELSRVYQTTSDPCARAAMAQALLLCSRFFGFSLPDTLTDVGVFQKLNIRLAARMAEKTLTRGGSAEIETLAFGATLKTLSHYLMSAAPAYLAREALFDLREKFHGRATM